MVRIVEILVAVLALFGVAIVLHFHPDIFVAVSFGLIFFFAIWAKGARLKWLSDLNRRSPEQTHGSPSVQLAPGPHEIKKIEEGRTIVRPITDTEARKIGNWPRLGLLRRAPWI